MTFTEGLIAARSRIIFLFGLATALALIVWLEGVNIGAVGSTASRTATNATATFTIEHTAAVQPIAPTALTTEEQGFARIAWKYFENNYQPATGLVNSVDNYPASTMWDTGSYLLAVLSAHKLGIISESVMNERLKAALQALATLPLFDNELPNKSYNTLTKEMADYANNKTPRGIGWSAIDVGRLFVPLHIIVWEHPKFAAAVREILQRFTFTHAVRDGILYGATLNDSNATIHTQEGRIGYEEYAAKSFSLMGTDVFEALKYDDFLHYESIYGINIPTDKRTPDRYKAFNYVVSESYILDGLEFGFDAISREFAFRVYKVQEERFNKTGVLTAVSEDNIDVAPYFVYNTVFTAGKAWSCITDKGEDVSQFRSISTKAAFGWYALYQTPYTQKLIDAVKPLNDPARGWYSGLYEATGKPNKAITGNTNAIILETLCYKKFGKHIQLVH